MREGRHAERAHRASEHDLRCGNVGDEVLLLLSGHRHQHHCGGELHDVVDDVTHRTRGEVVVDLVGVRGIEAAQNCGVERLVEMHARLLTPVDRGRPEAGGATGVLGVAARQHDARHREAERLDRFTERHPLWRGQQRVDDGDAVLVDDHAGVRSSGTARELEPRVHTGHEEVERHANPSNHVRTASIDGLVPIATESATRALPVFSSWAPTTPSAASVCPPPGPPYTGATPPVRHRVVTTTGTSAATARSMPGTSAPATFPAPVPSMTIPRAPRSRCQPRIPPSIPPNERMTTMFGSMRPLAAGRSKGRVPNDLNVSTACESTLVTQRASWISPLTHSSAPRPRASRDRASASASRKLPGPSPPDSPALRIAAVNTMAPWSATSAASKSVIQAVSSTTSVPWA